MRERFVAATLKIAVFVRCIFIVTSIVRSSDLDCMYWGFVAGGEFSSACTCWYGLVWSSVNICFTSDFFFINIFLAVLKNAYPRGTFRCDEPLQQTETAGHFCDLTSFLAERRECSGARSSPTARLCTRSLSASGDRRTRVPRSTSRPKTTSPFLTSTKKVNGRVTRRVLLWQGNNRHAHCRCVVGPGRSLSQIQQLFTLRRKQRLEQWSFGLCAQVKYKRSSDCPPRASFFLLHTFATSSKRTFHALSFQAFLAACRAGFKYLLCKQQVFSSRLLEYLE